MPTMFPSMASDSDDPNRSTTKWKPGDPTPRTAIAAFALVLIVAVLMIVSGFFMLTAQWDRAPENETEAEAMQFVLNNTRILGGINLVIGAALAVLASGIRDGYRRKRRWVLWLGALGIFFMLAGWVFQFTGMGQALIALLLAVALLLAYRPSADPYFDAGHRLDPEDTGATRANGTTGATGTTEDGVQ
ncbi:hypothetical protein [Corynebacterium falsenii]|uniref:hypothetical protein n=1 Tax=Corynebacterium falsenii TaxID=108486 RepID=UPI003FD645E0